MPVVHIVITAENSVRNELQEYWIVEVLLMVRSESGHTRTY